MSDCFFVNSPKVEKFVQAASGEDLPVILTLYLFMCDSSRDKEVLTSGDIDMCLEAFGEDRTYPVLDKWFLTNDEGETYTPLVSLLEFTQI